MTAPEVELRAAWHRLSGAPTVARPDHRPSDAFESLLARLREPHRHYHTATHVMWVLRHADDILRHPSCAALDADAVRLAALWHDAVYDPTAVDNEAVSARLAHEVALSLGWDAARAALVEALVRSTEPGTSRTPHADGAAHGAVDEFDVLHDADLAILGSEPAQYQAYVNAVRREYAHVSDDDWRRGRPAVLRSILATRPLFRTAAMATRTARAEANLAAELASLEH
ncbi:MAG: metal-dependent phosphohydrolase [Ilumatobacteraceae bacterium]